MTLSSSAIDFQCVRKLFEARRALELLVRHMIKFLKSAALHQTFSKLAGHAWELRPSRCIWLAHRGSLGILGIGFQRGQIEVCMRHIQDTQRTSA